MDRVGKLLDNSIVKVRFLEKDLKRMKREIEELQREGVENGKQEKK